MAKSDMSMAFRNVPLLRKVWKWLVMKAEYPITKQVYFFVDKCLPFGSSISCAIFQDISNAVAHIVSVKVQAVIINYLDDYLFAAVLKVWVDGQVRVFLGIHQTIKFPVALEKTFWGSLQLTFLGLLLDTQRQLICIPCDKLEKARLMIQMFLNKTKRKAMVLEFQKLCGFLNFLCRCIVPRRAFVRRLITGKLKPHHHVRISQENRLDLMIWEQFLSTPEAFRRLFMDPTVLSATAIDMFSDASRNFKLGVGTYCGADWTWMQWDLDFMQRNEPSIEYLELYGVAIAVLNWLHKFKNRNIALFCDNQAVVHMINNSSLSCRNYMVLIRLIVLEGLLHNTRVFAWYVGTKENGKADALSRLDFDRFWRLSEGCMNPLSTVVPSQLRPMHKIWLK